MARPEVSGKAIGQELVGTADETVYVPAARVLKRYGVSAMTVHRWLHSAKLNFPKPLYIGRYRYWRLADLTAWERARSTSR